MSTHKQRSARKERFWRGMVRQCRRSGLTVRAFCSAHGLSEPSYYAWRRTLAERDSAPVQFVPVQVTAEPLTTADASPGAAGAAGAVELLLGAGRRLRVEPGFDGPTLQRLLALLEQSSADGQRQAEGRP